MSRLENLPGKLRLPVGWGGDGHNSSDSNTRWVQEIREQCADELEPIIREDVLPLVAALRVALPYIEFYAEREINAPANGEAGVEDAKDMRKQARAALAAWERGSG